MSKDLTGNKAATFVTLAASNHSAGEREKMTITLPSLKRLRCF